QMVDHILALEEGQAIMLLAPIVKDRKGEHLHVFDELRSEGYIRARIDGIITDLEHPPKLDKNKKHSIEAVIDRLKVRADIQTRLAESLETAITLADGTVILSAMDDAFEDKVYSSRYACPVCGYCLPELEPRLFSFNNPAGACSDCDGLGVRRFFDPTKLITSEGLSLAEGAIRGWDRRNNYYFSMLRSLSDHYIFELDTPYKHLPEKIKNVLLQGSGRTKIDFAYEGADGHRIIRSHSFEGIIPNLERRHKETESDAVREELDKYLNISVCPTCSGSRLNRAARHVFIQGRSLPEVTALSIGQAHQHFSELKLSGQKGVIAEKILREIRDRLNFLVNVGLDYLTLSRNADSLSGGEAQRIRLASQIGAGLVGVMYILDEPSIGLHQRDNMRLLSTLTHLRDLGNTVIVVEHDEDAIRLADHVIDIGPGAGIHGGEIIASGTCADLANHPDSITGAYLSGKRSIHIPETLIQPDWDKSLTITGANGNNLKGVDLRIPLGLFTCVTGVSGSGKSTLINQTLYPIAATTLNGATTLDIAPHKEVEGLDLLDKVVNIDQSPIGRTPRSNPATYTGLFTPIRELFAATQEARSRGYKPGRFSFNVKGGRCEACQGDGMKKVEMHFLPDVYVNCDVCNGKRYNRESLEVRYKGKNIHEVLDLTVEEAREYFDAVPALARKLQALIDVGLSYIHLGQAATTLSGGEAQRVKLARELSKRDTGKTLYILDEPTTGLHFYDIEQLLQVLHRLRDHGNTVVVIEHNLDVVKTGDWVIDLGPEGGEGGGMIVGTGTPETLTQCEASHTGHFLKPFYQKA
ncbi:MAG: excinuclease ABC subunit UvrA, partial [Gammaproteobacteria bacterium]|nr:excinuclease ABC subunit UvrA [Gammaproteobacteria bacterium]